MSDGQDRDLIGLGVCISSGGAAADFGFQFDFDGA